MRLDYLDGIEDEQDEIQFIEHETVDLSDFASVYDDEEMGNIFKKVGSAVKKAAKKVGDKVGEGIRFVNRYINPATLLLRNGFLLAMKINLMNVAGRLRYGYLTDSQAQAKGMNMSGLKKLRSIKERAETVYWQAGGKKANLKKAILRGKGNKDKKVPLSGLDGLDNVYADQDEYNIIYSDNIEGLGEIASGTAIAAATSAVAAIAGALKQVKGLFVKDAGDEKSFQSETDNAGTASSAPATTPEDEDAFQYEEAPSVPSPTIPITIKPNATTTTYKTPTTTSQPMVSNESASSGSMLVSNESAASDDAVQTQVDSEKAGLLQKTQGWIKENPGKSLLVAGGIITGGILLMRTMRGGSSTNGLNGLPPKKSKKRKYKKKKSTGKKAKVKAQNLL